MKLIDEKGRLFGKINLIDLLVVLLIVGGGRIIFRRQAPGNSAAKRPRLL